MHKSGWVRMVKDGAGEEVRGSENAPWRTRQGLRKVRNGVLPATTEHLLNLAAIIHTNTSALTHDGRCFLLVVRPLWDPFASEASNRKVAARRTGATCKPTSREVSQILIEN
mgnify:CR=1 FL=1